MTEAMTRYPSRSLLAVLPTERVPAALTALADAGVETGVVRQFGS